MLNSHRAIAPVAGAILAGAAAAGPLTPPPGPPSPTYKTIQQAEPRTPLTGGTGSGISISQPGSYYLTENVVVTVANADGIRINSVNVTLDLNGFSILGTGVGDDGIVVDTPPIAGHVVVRNGHVDDFTGDGVISASSGMRATFDSIYASNCLRGFNLLASGLVTNCVAHDNDDDGFESFNQTVFFNCVADENGLDGFDINEGVVTSCASSGNEGAGFRIGFTVTTGQLAQAVDCSARSNTVGFVTPGPASLVRCSALRNRGVGFDLGSGNVVTDCLAQQSSGNGFQTGSNTVLRGCVADTNSGDGFQTGGSTTIDGCAAEDNAGEGFDTNGTAVSITNSVANSNGANGFVTFAATNISHCVATSNGVDGFRLSSDTSITNCVADAHNTAGSAGIRGSSDCRIEGNLATDNDIGIIGGTGSLVIRNAAAGNGTSYNVGGANYGGVVTAAGPISSSNVFANVEF